MSALVKTLVDVPKSAALGELPSTGFIDRLFDREVMESLAGQRSTLRRLAGIPDMHALKIIKMVDMIDSAERDIQALRRTSAQIAGRLIAVADSSQALIDHLKAIDLKVLLQERGLDVDRTDFMNAQKDHMFLLSRTQSTISSCTEIVVHIDQVFGNPSKPTYNIKQGNSEYDELEEESTNRDWADPRLISATRPNLLEVGHLARRIALSEGADAINIAERLPAFRGWGETVAGQVEAIGDVALRAGEVERARQALDAAVLHARESGLAWNAVAAAVGVSPQAAHRKWDSEARKKHSDYRRQANKDAEATD